MIDWLPIMLLAQGEDAAPAPSFGETLMPLLLPFAAIFLLYHLIIARPQRKEQARRDELLKSLKKNDPVVTIGGIFGTVVSVSEDGGEVTIRVDDNARLKIRRDAIREVVRKDASPQEGDQK